MGRQWCQLDLESWYSGKCLKMQQSQVVVNTSFCSVDKPNLSETKKKDADMQDFGWFHYLSKAMLSVILKDLK